MKRMEWLLRFEEAYGGYQSEGDETVGYQYDCRRASLPGRHTGSFSWFLVVGGLKCAMDVYATRNQDCRVIPFRDGRAGK